MVYNDPIFLKIWVQYYGTILGFENLFCLDHGSSDGSTDEIGIYVHHVERVDLDEYLRAKTVSEFHEKLLKKYDCVIYTDCDEFLVADPYIYKDLRHFIESKQFNSVTAIGVNVLHMLDTELPIDLDRSILSQRRYAQFRPDYCKTLISSVPIEWQPGFHVSNHLDIIDPDLFLFHLKYFDYTICTKQFSERKKIKWSEVSRTEGFGFHWRLSERENLDYLNRFDTVQISDSLIDNFFFRKNIKSYYQTYEYFDGSIAEIPERFRNAIPGLLSNQGSVSESVLSPLFRELCCLQGEQFIFSMHRGTTIFFVKGFGITEMKSFNIGDLEENGAWTLGYTSAFSVEPPSNDGRLLATLVITPFLHPQVLPTQRLRVSVNNTVCFEAQVSHRIKCQFALPEGAYLNGECVEFILWHPDAASPSDVDESLDERKLGFKIHRCEIASIDSDESLSYFVNYSEMEIDRLEALDDVGIVLFQSSDADPGFLKDDPVASPLRFERTFLTNRFGKANISQSIQIYSTLLPGPQISFSGTKNGLQMLSNKRRVLSDHYYYPGPPDINAYSVANGTLVDAGLVISEDQWVCLWDCIPSYWEEKLRNRALWPSISNLLNSVNWNSRRIIAVDFPISCPIHPNLVYGHFLLEMLPRIYNLYVLQTLGVEFRLALPMRLPEWILQYISLYFRDKEILFYNPEFEVVSSKSIILTSMMHNSHNFHPAFNIMVDDIIKRLQIAPPNRPNADSPRKIYVSRGSNSNNTKKRLTNNEEIEKIMVDAGYTIVIPETMSIKDQIQLFHHSDIIAAEYGSAIHNTIFSTPGTHIICIDFRSHYQSSIGRLRQLPHYFVTPADGQYRHWQVYSEEDRVYNVDPDALISVLSSVNQNFFDQNKGI